MTNICSLPKLILGYVLGYVSEFQDPLTHLKTLIERFANSTSADDLFDSFNAIYRDADRDPELKGWFRQVDRYVRKCLQEQGYILQDNSTEEFNKLQEKGEYLLRDRYRDHTNRVLDEFKFFGLQFNEDPQNKRFGDSVQKLLNNLGNDDNGKPAFKPHLLKDLSNVVIPGVFESVAYVPIPRIEYSDPMMDAIVENLVVESDNLMPNLFEVASDNHFRWGRKNVTSMNKNKVMVSVSGVQMDLRGKISHPFYIVPRGLQYSRRQLLCQKEARLPQRDRQGCRRHLHGRLRLQFQDPA